MAKITTINEPWDRHDYPEVEEFVKDRLEDYKKESEIIAYSYAPRLVPLTFEAAEDGVKIFFNCHDSEEATRTVEVSTDGGETWNAFTSEVFHHVLNTPIATLNKGEKAIVRGNNEAMGYYSETETDFVSAGSFRLDGHCYVYGNVMSILDWQNFRTKEDVGEYAFCYLFNDYNGDWYNDTLLSHPSKRLILPATRLSTCCYFGMFLSCTAMQDAPIISATRLGERCCAQMFCSCSGLVTAPELPAVQLAESCYDSMFSGCSSLLVAPELPATTLVSDCYSLMFSGCTKLKYIKALFTTMNTLDLNNWVRNVFAYGTFVKSPSLTMIMRGDSGIPNNWYIEDAS